MPTSINSDGFKIKVQLFREGHKNLHHPPYGFDINLVIYLVNVKTIEEDGANFCDLLRKAEPYLLGGRLGDALPPTAESREVCLEYEGLEPGPVGDMGADPARGMSLICCDSDNRRGSVEDEALDGAAGSE